MFCDENINGTVVSGKFILQSLIYTSEYLNRRHNYGTFEIVEAGF